MRVRIGTIGFSYDDWRSAFYPKEVKPTDRLNFYAQHYDCVELDTTFHAVPPPQRFANWAAQVPADFRFALKAPRAITHDAALTDAVPALRDFVRVASHLGEKLGVVLIQFSPALPARVWPQLERILDQLPPGPRYAMEFRNNTWFQEARIIDDLRSRQIALVGAEYLVDPREPIATTDFLFIRLIGEHGRYNPLNFERYDPTPKLEGWLEKINALKGVKEAWIVIGNDYTGFSIPVADKLKQMLGQTVEPLNLRQGRLF